MGRGEGGREAFEKFAEGLPKNSDCGWSSKKKISVLCIISFNCQVKLLRSKIHFTKSAPLPWSMCLNIWEFGNWCLIWFFAFFEDCLRWGLILGLWKGWAIPDLALPGQKDSLSKTSGFFNILLLLLQQTLLRGECFKSRFGSCKNSLLQYYICCILCLFFVVLYFITVLEKTASSYTQL